MLGKEMYTKMYKRKLHIVNPVRFWIIIGLVILVMVFSIVFTQADREYHTKTIYIEPGATLWELSLVHNNTDMEIRKYIELVCNINKIDANIHPGQTIEMPIYE